MQSEQRITRELAMSQERRITANAARVYTLYTEYRDNLAELIARYFDGATILDGVGLWRSVAERSAVVEILARPEDLQKIANLAGDIRVVNNQASVLITWADVSTLSVGE